VTIAAGTRRYQGSEAEGKLTGLRGTVCAHKGKSAVKKEKGEIKFPYRGKVMKKEEILGQ